jgi:hypothetical protein
MDGTMLICCSGKFSISDIVPPAAPPVAPEIVMEFRLTPTLTPPAPDTFNRLLAVPEELSVVLPRAVIEIVEKFVTLGVVAETVIELRLAPTLTIPAPDT